MSIPGSAHAYPMSTNKPVYVHAHVPVMYVHACACACTRCTDYVHVLARSSMHIMHVHVHVRVLARLSIPIMYAHAHVLSRPHVPFNPLCVHS